MRANSRFINKSSSFWAYVKLLSEQLGYSKKGFVRIYSDNEAIIKLQELDIKVDNEILCEVLEYIEYRAKILNKNKDFFMNVDEAKEQFKKALELYKANNYTSNLPRNKQKGEKKDYAYFTCIINIITETVLRKFCFDNNLRYEVDIDFDDDPQKLTYITSKNRELKLCLEDSMELFLLLLTH